MRWRRVMHREALRLLRRNEITLNRFKAAWVAGDIAGLMDLVTDDVVYAASCGPEPGETFCGRDNVRAGILHMLAHDANARVIPGETFFFSGRAFSAWVYESIDSAGEVTRETGCDLFTFRNGLIARKDAYRKCRTP